MAFVVVKVGGANALWNKGVMSRRFRLHLSRAWQGLRRDGWVRTWDRSSDFLRRMVPWTPRHALVRPSAACIDALTEVPCAESPLVSIVIPVFNKVEYTLECLAALVASGDATNYEAIVVDDGSSDATADRVSGLKGVRYTRNPSNEGFIGSCNRGAELARGEFLVFLNNDTAVQPGWLDAMVSTFQAHPKAGLVGAKLLYGDGTLQEAGGILYKDGRGGNYGRFDAALDPRYTHVREVDYCSGAAIAIRKELFEQLGRFDDRYRPAYYEDADLAMRVREAGYKVLYQPHSVVIHFEGITSGTSEAGGVKAYQVRNREVFLERWRERLLSDHPAWGLPLDLAVARGQATLMVFDDGDAAVKSAAVITHLLADGRSLMVLMKGGTLPSSWQHQWEQQGVEIWSGYWRTGLRGWVRRYGSRVAEVRVTSDADASTFGRLWRARPEVRVVRMDNP